MSAPAFHYGHSMKPLFMLEEGITYLNHGAYGATLRELLDYQRSWIDRMESQPARFFMSELPDLVRLTVDTMAPNFGADPSRTVMVENATSGVNAVLRSLDFDAGDHIVTTDHVYNAVRNILRHVCKTQSVACTEVPVRMPLTTETDIADLVISQCTAATRLVVIDHIASPSGIIFPVAQIVKRCRERKIPVLVDGSHAPGTIDLDISDIGADWYVGNCHKWLCAPKGAAFITVGAENRQDIHPSIISHAYGKGLTAEFGKIGTRDPSAWLCVPAAIDAHSRLGGRSMRNRNRELALDAAHDIAKELHTEIGAPDDYFGPMVTVRIPSNLGADPQSAMQLRETLWSNNRIDAIVSFMSDALWIRLCAFAYNEKADYSLVAGAVQEAVQAVSREASK